MASVGSLRPERLDYSRLFWALVVSLVLHGVGWGGYELGKKFHIWERLDIAAWVKKLGLPSLLPAKSKPNQPVPDREPPLMFVNVTPQQATTEPPKNAPYYSALNSKAANPDSDRDSNIPKISGKQEQVPKTEDVEREKITKLQPALPDPEPKPEERAASKPELTPGDLTMAKPELNPRKDAGTAEKTRPRTLAQAAAQKQLDRIPGQKMKQDGGVARREKMESLDAKATEFGAYDQLLIEAISQHWYDLLKGRDYASDARGHVILEFKLHYDGTVTDVKVTETTVSGTLSIMCEKAVIDPAPFERWPRELRLKIAGDVRTLRFAFYYN